MRSPALTGGALALAVALTVAVSSALDLDLTPLALTGVAVGGAVALVPAASPFARLLGFGLGAFLALIGYIVRAAVLPDISAGRAIAFAIIIALVTLAAYVSRGHAPLWAGLLGTGTFAGVYEATFASNPPEVVSTSAGTFFALLPAFAVGFLIAVLTEPAGSVAPKTGRYSDLDNTATGATDLESTR